MESTEDPRIKQFWDGYFETIRLFRVPENRYSWYQIHIESFIRFLPNVRLLDRKPEHIEQWLTQTGRNAELSDWQFQQQVDALVFFFRSCA